MADTIPGGPGTTATLVNGTANSTIDVAGDIDWFLVTLQAGWGYQVWLEGSSSFSGTLADPFLGVYNGSGTLLASDDDGATGLDSFVYFTATQSGTYYLSASAFGTSTGTYRLTMEWDALASIASTATITPNSYVTGTLGYGLDTSDWSPITLVAGVNYQFDLVGDAADSTETLADPFVYLRNASGTTVNSDDDSGVGLSSRMFFTPSTTGTYYVDARSAGTSGSGTYRLIVNQSPVEASIAVGTPAAGSLTFNGDTDLFSVSLTAGVAYNITVAAGTLADPFLEVMDASGAVVTYNDDSSGLSSGLSFTPSSSGTYFLGVRASGFTGTGTYTLAISSGVAADRYENNDSAGTATVLGTISGTRTESGLSMQAGDDDWYRFTLGANGRVGDNVALNFTHSAGDIDMALYDSTGTVFLGSSAGVGNQESISLAGVSAGTYLLRAYGYAGASNANYSLSVTATPPTSGADRFEDNDTAGTATSLGTISGTRTETGLTVQANESDWYRFTLASAGRYGDALTLNFTHALGDVDLQLYDSTGTQLVGSSTGVGDSESISLSGLAAGTYVARVYGFVGASNPNYTLGITAAPSSAADRFEDNDTAGTATSLGTISGTRTEANLSAQANDSDWYQFTLGAAGRSGDAVTASFLHSQGDVDMELYDSTGATRLASSAGVGNQESISLAGFAAGTYKVRVFGYNGASNSNYSLSVSAAPQASSADRFENNDTAGTATDLRTVSGTLVQSSLSIEAGDPDWYKFTLAGAGRTGDALTVNFTHAQGDIDIELYDATGTTVVARSNGVGNQEQVSLAGLAAGNYLVKVYGYGGAANPDYSLTVTAAPQGVTADRFEDNDTALTATDLRTISGTVTQTSLTAQANDSDWYRFTLAAPGRAGDGATMSFSHALGDLDLQLYNAAGTTVLASSTGTGDSETVSFNGLAAGTYLLRAYGYGGASNANYSLALSAAPQAASGDRFEDNDTAATATSLRTITGTVTESGLSIQANDPDWYTFTLASAGRAGDAATITFTNAQGDLDLQLYNAAGTSVLSSSTGTGNSEQVSLSGLAAGTYMLKVYGYSGAANPNYTLTVNAAQPAAIGADPWESNNTSGTATALRDASQTISGATLTAGDLDFYTFTLPQAGASTDRVTLHAGGTGVTVQLLNAQQQVVSQGASDANGLANLSLSGVAAGQYFVRVAGATASTTAQYDLELRAAGSAPPSNTAASTWTVLVYVNGDNDLESAAIDDINEMEAALNRAGVNVAVMVDRSSSYDSSNGNWADARRGVIVHDTSVTTISSSLTSVGEADMGAASTLTSFLDWGAQNAPAQHYMVVVWDHGGGPINGASFDSQSGHHLTTAQVASSISASQLSRVDIIGFDACLMAAVEVMSQMEPVANLLIASELTEPGDGWDYLAILNYLQASSTATGLAATVVDSYGTFYGQQQTLSTVDLTHSAAVEAAMNAFAAVMNTANATDWQAVITARSRAAFADSGYSYLVDVNSFMRELMTASSNATIDNAAQNVINAVQSAVLRHSGLAAYTGLTVVFPSRGTTIPGGYTAGNFDFVDDTAWENFLGQYLSRSSLRASIEGFTAGAPDFAESLTLSAQSTGLHNDTIDTPFQLGTINSADYAIRGLTLDSVDDADWFTFTMPAGNGLTPSLNVTLSAALSGVQVQLLAANGTVIATTTTTGASNVVTFNQVAAGGTYLLAITAPTATQLPEYDLHFNAFGSGAATVLADFAEAAGGNNSMDKAWQLGSATQLALRGDVANLSLEAADLAGGASGGDWFRIDSARTTESNVNSVQVVGVSNAASSLTVKVYDINGTLIGQSAPGQLSVTFAWQVDDIYVQVQSSGAVPVTGYSLRLENVGDIYAPTIATFDPADGATSVPVANNLTVTFNEEIVRGTGNIVLKTAAGATVETFDAALSQRLSINGGALTIDPTATLAAGTHYVVEFAAGSVKDAAGNSVAATASWDFTTFLAGQAFNGSALVDNITGTAGNDTINTGAGRDTITGGLGDDAINGGADRDLAIFAGLRGGYAVSVEDNGTVTVLGPDGRDTLTDVERAKFNDFYMAFDINGNAGDAYRLYQAAFDRVPDIGGVGFQMNQLDLGRTLASVAQDFLNSPEFQSKYGNVSDDQYVVLLYQNVLHRTPAQDEIDFHVDHELHAGYSRAQVLTFFSDSPENRANVIGAIEDGILYTL